VLDIDLSLEGEQLVCRRVLQGLTPSRLVSDYFHARAARLLALMAGPIEPLEVRLMHREPSDLREYRRLLGERLRFRAAEDALLLPASVLARSAPQPDAAMAGVLVQHLASLPELDGGTGDLVTRVRRSIQEELREGRATMQEISERLQINERTMRRRLSELGASFQQLLDEVRRVVAIRSLHEPRCSVSELSRRLGFCGPAAFYRAFRRWTGQSLSEYRAAQGADPLDDRSALP
jgi:AraC-like DNA-binding protein